MTNRIRFITGSSAGYLCCVLTLMSLTLTALDLNAQNLNWDQSQRRAQRLIVSATVAEGPTVLTCDPDLVGTAAPRHYGETGTFIRDKSDFNEKENTDVLAGTHLDNVLMGRDAWLQVRCVRSN